MAARLVDLVTLLHTAVGFTMNVVRGVYLGSDCSIETDVLASVVSDKTQMAKVLSRTPLGRIGQPNEIGSVAVFLASQESSYITGQTIYVDGGRLALNYTVPVPQQDK